MQKELRNFNKMNKKINEIKAKQEDGNSSGPESYKEHKKYKNLNIIRIDLNDK